MTQLVQETSVTQWNYKTLIGCVNTDILIVPVVFPCEYRQD